MATTLATSSEDVQFAGPNNAAPSIITVRFDRDVAVASFGKGDVTLRDADGNLVTVTNVRPISDDFFRDMDTLPAPGGISGAHDVEYPVSSASRLARQLPAGPGLVATGSAGATSGFSRSIAPGNATEFVEPPPEAARLFAIEFVRQGYGNYALTIGPQVRDIHNRSMMNRYNAFVTFQSPLSGTVFDQGLSTAIGAASIAETQRSKAPAASEVLVDRIEFSRALTTGSGVAKVVADSTAVDPRILLAQSASADNSLVVQPAQKPAGQVPGTLGKRAIPYEPNASALATVFAEWGSARDYVSPIARRARTLSSLSAPVDSALGGSLPDSAGVDEFFAALDGSSPNLLIGPKTGMKHVR